MKKEFQVVYLPIGVPTFHLESAQAEYEKSIALLCRIDSAMDKTCLQVLTRDADSCAFSQSVYQRGDCPSTDTDLNTSRSKERGVISHLIYPDQMLLSIDLLRDFLDRVDPDLILLQNVTFANAAYAGEVLHRFQCPILLWTLPEPIIDGGRLRLNSLTGAFSAANMIRSFRREKVPFILGSPDESSVQKKITSFISAAKLRQSLRSLKIASIGHTPEGFGFGRATDQEMLRTFGSRLVSIEARELILLAQSYPEEEVQTYLEDAYNRTGGLEQIPEKNRIDFARLYKAYRSWAEDNGIRAIASRCWPDFFTAFGTPVCAVLSILNDLGIAAGCEADTYGALSMYLGRELSGQSVFFGDPVSLNEEQNSITFWHCGMAPCSLAREDTGAQVGVHCNRKIGPTMEFGCKPCDHVTIFRIGKDEYGEFRIWMASGNALDMPKQFNGTSIVVHTNASAVQIVQESVEAGWEPHFAVAYGDITEELSLLADMLHLRKQIYA